MRENGFGTERKSEGVKEVTVKRFQTPDGKEFATRKEADDHLLKCKLQTFAEVHGTYGMDRHYLASILTEHAAELKGILTGRD